MSHYGLDRSLTKGAGCKAGLAESLKSIVTSYERDRCETVNSAPSTKVPAFNLLFHSTATGGDDCLVLLRPLRERHLYFLSNAVAEVVGRVVGEIQFATFVNTTDRHFGDLS